MVEAVINSLTTNLNHTLNRNLTIHKKDFALKTHNLHQCRKQTSNAVHQAWNELHEGTVQTDNLQEALEKAGKWV